MNEVPSLTELVKRIKAGDIAAVGHIHTYYKNVLIRAVRDFLNKDNPLRSVYWTEDIQQTVYRRLLDVAVGAKPDGNLSAGVISVQSGAGYIKRIAINRVMDLGRQKAMVSHNDQVTLVADPAPSPELQAELKDLVENLMKQLSERHRKIADRRGKGENWKEIAGTDSIKVERAFERACRKLKDQTGRTSDGD